MRWRAVAWALVAVPTMSAAQSTTQCTTTFGVTNCTTQPQGGGVNWNTVDPNAYSRGYETSRRAVEAARLRAIEAQRQQALVDEARAMGERDRALFEQKKREAALDEEARALGRRAGEMIVAGDCPGAEKLALAEGYFDMAMTIKKVCAERLASQQP